MKIHILILISCLQLFACAATNTTIKPETGNWGIISPENQIKDYINAGTQIQFNKTEYSIKWSSNPYPGYFKQKYLQQGDSLNNHTEIITIEAIQGNASVRQAIQLKITELDELKKKDPAVTYIVYRKGNQYILDFVLQGPKNTFEWNLYRYIKIKKKHLILLAYTQREKQKEIDDFFTHIANSRNKMVKALDKIKLPKLKI